jgi:RNA polymerase sigma-70 factor (ECF subfamily)
VEEAARLHTGAVEGTAAQLVVAASHGDRRAFDALVGPHLGWALATAKGVTSSSPDALDAVQDALLSAWQALPSLRSADAFPLWFRRHVVRAALRIATSRPAVVELEVLDAPVADDIDQAIDALVLARAYRRLEPKDRLLVTCHFLWDLPVRETAGLLGIPEGTVRSRVHHALRRLRAAFDAEERA